MEPFEILHDDLAEARKCRPPRPKPPAPETTMAKQAVTEDASYAAYNTFGALLKYQTQVAQGAVTMVDFQSQVRTGSFRNFLTYRELRSLADEADLVRLAIEDVKSTIKGLDWEITVEKGATLNPLAEKWVDSPDRSTPWDNWASQLAEEYLVPDAACIFPWFAKGRIDRLEVIDGTTIAYLTDRVTGRLPDPPLPCYEQTQPDGKRKKYNRNELWLLPQNRRVGTLRGFSPVEQVMARASVNISKVFRDMYRWLHGGTPPGVVGTPDGMDFEVLKRYQKWLDEQIRRPAGDSLLTAVAGQGKITTIPPIPFTKEHEESLGRIICKAIGSDPTSLVSEVNYNTSDALQRWAMLRGVWPLLWFLAYVVDQGLALGQFPGHHLTWKAQREAEDFARRQAELAEYESGILAWEEIREGRGHEVKAGNIKGKHFMVVGKSMQAFDPLADPGEVKNAPPIQPPFFQKMSVSEDGKMPPGANGEDGEGAAQKACPSCGKGGGGLYKAAFFRARETEDLRRWERVARKALKAGEEQRDFQSEFIPTWKRQVIQKALRAPELGVTVFKKDGLQKAVRHLGSGIGVGTSKKAKAQETPGMEVFRSVFQPIADHIIAAAIRRGMKAGLLEKADGVGDIPPPSQEAWKKLLRWLEENFQIGVGDTADLLGDGASPDLALEYARERAGALIGRTWDTSSQSWIENTDESLAIPGKMRAAANEIVSQAVEEGWAMGELKEELAGLFSDSRALTIARTELATAYNTGAAMNYAAQGVEYVVVTDGFGCLADGHDDAAPQASGGIGLEEENQADGQIWTVAEALQFPIGHPNCVRAFIPATDKDLEEAA